MLVAANTIISIVQLYKLGTIEGLKYTFPRFHMLKVAGLRFKAREPKSKDSAAKEFVTPPLKHGLYHVTTLQLLFSKFT